MHISDCGIESESFTSWTQHKLSTIDVSQHVLVADNRRSRGLGNTVRMPIVIRIPVRDENVRNAFPLFFRNQRGEPEEVHEQATRIDGNFQIPCLDQKRVVEVVRNPQRA